MKRTRIRFIVGFAIGRWSREYGINAKWLTPEFEQWVEEAVNDALQMIESADDFEQDALAELRAIFAEPVEGVLFDQTTQRLCITCDRAYSDPEDPRCPRCR